MSDLRDDLQRALGAAYTIERELGGGGMSRVFLAREKQLNREVVVKVLSADLAGGVSVERFGREIQLAASLSQANIVPLLAAGDADGVPYFTMPYVQGESLRGRLATGAPIPIGECIGIVRDVARALSYAHARGIVHRDIKPDNVLLSHGAAMVTDFGIAKAVSASRTMGDAATLTQAGTSLGTPAYMSPEQIAGDSDVGPRADLYAWGCLAFEVLTGKPPFVRESAQRVLAAHLSEVPAPIAPKRADVPVALERLVLRCLAKDPAERPASADEVLRELEVVVTPSGMSSERAVSGARVDAGIRRSPGPTTLVMGVAALLVVATLALWRGGNAPSGGSSSASANTAAPDRSIAVLPLANLSGDKADDYFGIGLAEEMTRALSKTGVRVIGRVSAGALQARGLDERAIAKALGVGSLLTGSVQRAAGQVRINVSLVSAADGAVRWTEKYDRPIANVFAVQDEIAAAVARKLLGTLSAGAARSTKAETTDPEAYALFLQGQVLFNRRTANTLQQAIDVYKRAVQRDPSFARAHAMLAMAQSVLPNYTDVPSEDSRARVMQSAGRAIAIDSTIAEAYTAMANSQQLTARYREADSLFRRSLAFDSTVATTWGWYGLLANHRGDFATAHERVARARALEPASLIARTWDAQIFLTERRYRAVDSATASIIALDSSFSLVWTSRAEGLLFDGHANEAVTLLERRITMAPDDRRSEGRALLALAYVRTGQTLKARALFGTLLVNGDGRPSTSALLSSVSEALGDHAAALVQLERSVTARDGWLTQFSRGERYDALRKDPRGAALLARVESW